MTSTRIKYDDCNYYNLELKESVRPGLYNTFPGSVENCNACLSTFGPRPSSNTGPLNRDPNWVDAESVLLRRNMVAGKCFANEVNPIGVDGYRSSLYKECSPYLDSQSTRLTHPSQLYKGLSYGDLQYDYPIRDPQANIYYDSALCTRNYVKDNYVPRKPYMLSQTGCLPRPDPPRNCSYRFVCEGEGCPKK